MSTLVISALVLGFAGSLHCLGMCGPLVMALHGAGQSKDWAWLKLVYHVGRILVYAALGAVIGSLGSTFVAIGAQQYLAVGAGMLMLLFIAWPAGMKGWKSGPLRGISWLKTRFASLIQKRTMLSHFLMGMLNGLLPCGMVYVALAAALAFGSLWKSALFMVLFGIGTSPALFVMGSLVTWISSRWRIRSFRGVQIALAMISLLVVLRGANLGIPYLSPRMAEKKEHPTEKVLDCCHRPKH